MLGFTPLSQSPFSAPAAANIVEASASTSCTSTTAIAYLRVKLADSAVSASASNTTTATRARNIDGAAMSSASSSSGSCERVRQDNQTVSASCTATGSFERVRQDNQLVSGASTVTTLSTYSRVRKGGSLAMSSAATFTAPRPYRTRLSEAQGAGASVVVTLYERWRIIDRIVATPAATVAGDIDRVRNNAITLTAASSISAAAGRTTPSSAVVTALSTVTAVGGRITQSGADIVQGVSTVVAEAREKWELIDNNDVSGFWTEQSVGSNTWTEVA